MRAARDHILLLLAVFVFCGPVLWALSAALAPSQITSNWQALTGQLSTQAHGPGLERIVMVSFVLAVMVALLSTLLSFLAAFSLVYFRAAWLPACFGVTLLTLYFPIEARMIHTFDVVASLGLTSSLAGLTLPVLQLALGTLFLRQRLKTLPPELFQAAQLDGAGPLRCLLEIALPLTWRAVAVLLLVTFVAGWNQYLWPLMASVDDRHWTLVRALERVSLSSGAGALLAAMAMLPPLVFVTLLATRDRASE